MVSPPEEGQGRPEEPPDYAFPLGAEIFPSGVEKLTGHDLRTLLDEPGWVAFMQSVRARIYDLKVNRGFEEDPQKNQIALLLAEGLSLTIYIFDQMKRDVLREEEEAHPEETDPVEGETDAQE